MPFEKKKKIFFDLKKILPQEVINTNTFWGVHNNKDPKA